MLLCASLLGLWPAAPPGGGHHARAAEGIQLVPGSVEVDDATSQAVLDALQSATAVVPELHSFAITDVRVEGGWAALSILGLAQVHDGQRWSLEQDGAWFGLALLRRSGDGWQGALQGTGAFSELLRGAPRTFIGENARADLEPVSRPRLLSESSYIFPWEAGAAMHYGALGVHDNGFSFGDHVGWKAVDMLSDGNTAAGHAPNRLLAAEAGTITYKCTDPNNVAVRIAGFFYTHLEDNAGLQTLASFAQGAELGQMKTGSFGTQGAMCGWATQGDNWFHIHWGFPNADLAVEDWTLSMSTENWTNGSQTITPGGGWITAHGLPTTLTISGNAGVADATLAFTGGSTTSDAGGDYTITVPYGWSGSVTPTKTYYTFTPTGTEYQGIASDLTAQDYAAALHTFADVPHSGKEWMEPWVDAFYDAGITTGCGTNPLRYCPEDPVTRAAMAVFVLRAIEGSSYVPPPVSHYFADMPVAGKEWMEPWVDEFYRRGITGGCAGTPLRYCPENPVTRAAMAVFVLRALDGSAYVPPATVHNFSDMPVPGKEWMEPFVDEFYARGITTGCGANPLIYCPESSVTRAAMAVFIDRAYGFYP